jgi:16S rRNA (uracil1498-N3)-methyltransferase
MRRIFLPLLPQEKMDPIQAELHIGGVLEVTGPDAVHIVKSLRMAVSDFIVICDMKNTQYRCEIIAINYDGSQLKSLSVKIVEIYKNDTETPYRASLYQALPKGDKMALITQKAVELGVYQIIPFISERCIARPDGESAVKKIERWQKISEEASKQCGRGIIPKINGIISYNEVLAEIEKCKTDINFICYEGDNTTPLKNIISGIGSGDNHSRDINFMIGPEGGFSITEIETAESKNLKTVNLGKRIMRCETASGYVLSCLSYEFEY